MNSLNRQLLQLLFAPELGSEGMNNYLKHIAFREVFRFSFPKELLSKGKGKGKLHTQKQKRVHGFHSCCTLS